MTKFQVIDGHTRAVVKVYKTHKRARATADRLDLEYGAVRYYTKAVADFQEIGQNSKEAGQ